MVEIKLAPPEERILYKSFRDLIKDNPEFKRDFPSVQSFCETVLPFYKITVSRPAIPKAPTMAYHNLKAWYFYGKHNGDEEVPMMAFIGVGFEGSSLQVVKYPDGGVQ